MRPFLFLLLFTALAQTAEVEISAEPHHHLVFTNDQVRVFNVEVPAHSETLLHRHRHDYVYVTLGDAEVVNAVAGKDPITVKLADGETRFTPGNFAHIARTTDRHFHNVTIELLQDDKLRHSPSHWDEARALHILHGGTAEILWVNDNVRASEIELQPNAIFPEGNHPPARLLVAVTDLDLSSVAHDHAAADHHEASPALAPIRLKSGETQWLGANQIQQLTNTGHALARFVILEFP